MDKPGGSPKGTKSGYGFYDKLDPPDVNEDDMEGADDLVYVKSPKEELSPTELFHKKGLSRNDGQKSLGLSNKDKDSNIKEETFEQYFESKKKEGQ